VERPVHFLTTGGTIDKVYFDAKSEYEVGPPQVVDVLREGNVTVPHLVEPLLAKDSLELTPEDRELIRQRVAASPHDQIVITHGTDTMVQTAAVLRSIPNKTIVLTGSMQPARMRNTDAVFNIGSALGAVQCLPPGVYLAMNGRIFPADQVRKNVAEHRFETLSPDSPSLS
jgi:L-asparaginase